MRAYRSLTISFGLLTVPVQIAPPFKSDKVSGNYICEQHHEKVSLKYDCPTCGTNAKRVTGYPVGDTFIVPTESDLMALESLSNKAIELDGFSLESEIDPVWYDKTYAVWAKKGGEKGVALLTAVFKGSGIVGVGTAVLEKSEVPVVVRYSPTLERLTMHTCHFNAELRRQELDGLGQVILPSDVEIKQAVDYIGSALGPWDLTQHVDHYQEGLKALLAGQPVAAAPNADEPQMDLIEALKASVDQQKNLKTLKSNGKVKA